jgi:hypothetical protein
MTRLQEVRPSAAPPGTARAALARRAAVALAAAVLAVALSGCTPEYNWRELRPDDAHWIALLPARPATATRDIRLGDVAVTMTMHGAKVRDTAFTVAEAPLPAAGDAAAALAVMRQALVRNIEGKELASAQVVVPVVAASGRQAGAAPGLSVEAAGTIRGKPALMQARLVAHAGRAYQALVVGTDLDPEQAKTFFDSFRLHD